MFFDTVHRATPKDITPIGAGDPPARGALAQNQYLSRLVNLLARARPSKWSSALNVGRQNLMLGWVLELVDNNRVPALSRSVNNTSPIQGVPCVPSLGTWWQVC